MTQRLDTLQAALDSVLGDAIHTLVRDRGQLTLTGMNWQGTTISTSLDFPGADANGRIGTCVEPLPRSRQLQGLVGGASKAETHSSAALDAVPA